MTFNQLFSEFQNKYGKDHDFIFFELLYSISRLVKNKDRYIQFHNSNLDFKVKKFDKLCNRYFVKQQPLAHITGNTTFCDLSFKVSKSVLAPRDVTQEMTRDFIAKHKNETAGSVYDLCCGCGCIGISIKKNIPALSLTCVDKYWGPITDTHANGVKHRAAMILEHADVFKYLTQLPRADYIISNPPYINPANFDNLIILKWESKKALIAKEEGLFFYKRYFEWLNTHEFKEAWFEIGFDLVVPLEELAKKFNNISIQFPKDKQYIIVTKNSK